MAIHITSKSFNEGEMIPEKHTCDDLDISPPLSWTPGPEGTVTFALICDDPDAPVGTWVHWVLFNLPGEAVELPEAVPPERELDNGAKQGMNDFGKVGYGGPCPPGGTHRYFFRIYALDRKVPLDSGAGKAELLDAMEGHILAEGRLMGIYSR